jgi:hypothetical protein
VVPGRKKPLGFESAYVFPQFRHPEIVEIVETPEIVEIVETSNKINI